MMNEDHALPKAGSVMITGATAGIGRATAAWCAKRGAALILVGRNAEKLRHACAQMEEVGASSVHSICRDLSLPDAGQGLFAEAEDLLGMPINTLINNAGAGGTRTHFTNTETDELISLTNLHFITPGVLARDAVTRMLRHKSGGKIINILTSACLAPIPAYAIYTGTKMALKGLSDVLRKEVREDGIAICSVYPGSTDTHRKFPPNAGFLTAKEVADVIGTVIQAPPHAAIQDIVLRPLCDTNY